MAIGFFTLIISPSKTLNPCHMIKKMQKATLFFESVRYLKPVQIYGRLSLYTRRKVLQRFNLYRLRYLNHRSGPLQVTSLCFPVDEQPAASEHDFATNTFTFLNRRVTLGNPINWLPTTESQLWQYNLHYFEYVAALGMNYSRHGDERAYQTFRRLVCEWIARCPVATPLAWDPYPSSLRICNWIKGYTWFEPAIREDTPFAAAILNSIYSQTRFLEDNLEYHLLGNHLIENGRALLLAGLFFSGDTASRWRTKGERILWRELHEQFLDDGGHDERSPMYHQMMLNLYEGVVAVLSARHLDIPDGVEQKIHVLREWLTEIRHPDGDIPLLNDAALRVAATPQSTARETILATDGLRPLPDSGYFVFRDRTRKHYLIFDCGPLGPDHQPGHGHCDTLSYELSLSGQRFIVDAGVGDYYGNLNWRTYYRSTRAHNTVVVDGAEQSEVWERFRVARRAYPATVHWEDAGERLRYVTGSHTGYQRLPGNIIHQRWVCWIDRSFWLICDRISGSGSHQIESLLHFHPEVQIVQTPGVNGQGQPGVARRGTTELMVIPWGASKIKVHSGESKPLQGWYSPEFGLQCRNIVWALQHQGELPLWFGYLLCPQRQSIGLSGNPIAEDRYQLLLQSADTQYRVICTPTHVTMETQP